MKRFDTFLMIVVLLVVVAIFLWIPMGNQAPRFVEEQIKNFDQFYRNDSAWARKFGWAKGIYFDGEQDQDFLWFSHCHPDGCQSP